MGLSVFLILFVLMGSVSAITDNITDLGQDTDNAIAQEKISTGNDDSSLKEIENNELLKTNPENTTLKTLVGGNTFADIQTAIDSAASGDTLELDGLYKGSGTPVIIDKNNLTIVGTDAILDAQGQSRIFNITGTGIILKNIDFINGNATDKGGAIYWYGVNGTVNDCNFANNKAAQMGGAIYWYGANGTINNSNFISNTAEKYSGGAIQWDTNSANGTVNSCNFTNNIGTQRGGAVYCQGKNGTINNSIFINNTSINGGAINWAPDALNGAVNNSIFINNTGNDGGTTYWEGKNGIMSNCEFINNTGTNGGAINWQKAYGLVSNCNFINNKATGNGGAMYWEGSNGTENNCNFTNNIAQSNGGAIYWYAYNGTISNTNFANNTAESAGGAIYAAGSLTLNNVTFINNYASKNGGAVAVYENVTINCNNSEFADNYAVEGGSSIVVEKGKLNLYNSYVTSKVYAKAGQIMGSTEAIFYLENITFANTTATYAPAIYLVGSKIRIIDSKFINLKANITAGAMSLREGGELYISNCEFINTTSSRNAGAVYVDITGYNPGNEGNVTIIDSKFNDASSEFGGAYVQLGGQFWLNNTEFINNHAAFNGGAIYLSFTETEINNCTFESNGAGIIEDYPTSGGAIFSDISTLNITNSRFFNNVASEGNAIYAYDNSFNIKCSTFKNNTNAVFSVFTKKYTIDTNTELNNDTVSTNNTFYATIMVGEGMELALVNNTINVNVIPTKFDLRDWGWVSSVKDQGWMGACWTFGMTGSLESVLLKATGIPFNVSMNNMKTVMKYSPYGAMEVFEGGANLASVSYLLSWLGAIPYGVDTYDELGKITMPTTTGKDIHVQDVIFIPNNEIPNGTQIKLAIMKYGSFDVSFFGQASFDDEVQYYNPKTYAQYVDVPETANHEVSIIGWDDNFPKEKFLYTPPGNGAWIVKNSYGSDWGDNGYLYVSYYDKSLLAYKPGKVTDYAATAIIENTVPYNKNYQYDITWLSNFKSGNGTMSYMNVFEALDDDLIAGVGTYFNESGVNYTVKIFVNDELKLTQKGVSPYVGYHTIKLGSYVPVKKGDVFKAEITSNWIPYLLLEDTRVHYVQNISYVSFDGKTWKDAYDLGYIACLKVYTVADDSKIINNKNIAVDYNGGKYFSVKVVTADGHAVGAGAKVTFTINKKTKTVKTDKNGIAKIKITNVPKKYTITTKYIGKTYKNTVTVKHVLKTSKVTVKKTAKKFTLKATLKINGKLVKGKIIKFKFNGKTYKAKTNKKGIAQKILTKKVINKLKKGKTYTVKVTYLKDTIKTTVKVKK